MTRRSQLLHINLMLLDVRRQTCKHEATQRSVTKLLIYLCPY